MTILEYFRDWKDRHGFISPWEAKDDDGFRKGSGNGNNYLGDAPTILRHHGVLMSDVKKEIVNAIHKNENPDAPGNFKRLPDGGFGYNAPDDQFGLALISKECEDEGPEEKRYSIAKRMLTHGRSTGGHFNAIEPGEWRAKGYFWRMPQLEAHTQFCAGELPNLYYQIIWMLVLVGGVIFKKRKRHDAFDKQWKMANGATRRTVPVWIKIAIIIWRIIFYWRWPGGIGQVRFEYGWRYDPPHFTVKYGWGV